MVVTNQTQDRAQELKVLNCFTCEVIIRVFGQIYILPETNKVIIRHALKINFDYGAFVGIARGKASKYVYTNVLVLVQGLMYWLPN